ncbi:MAG: hypothetical protein HZC28_20200 [Spirochaetes bacterium]|nr:hypothetical protein [Spirochaetota bacterium]
MLLGELLISKKIITELQLQRCLDKAREQKKMIGEVLVAEKIITRDELNGFLKEQGYLKDNIAPFKSA